MTSAGLMALGSLALGLAVVIGLELRPGSADEGAMNFAPPRVAAPTTPTAAPGGQAAGRTQEWAATALARPLFAVNRRPPAGVALEAAGLPRVAGILVDGSSRSVIFAAAEGGKPVVVREGAEVAGFRVQSIETAQVTVIGPGGARVLRPSFDPAPRPVQGGLPGLPGLAGIPGVAIPGAPAGPAAR